VIISGFLVLFQVKRYKISVKNFEQIVIYLILLQIYPQRTVGVTEQIAGEPGLSRGCAASVPLLCAEFSLAGAGLGGRAAV
jgi:hypothetical protein